MYMYKHILYIHVYIYSHSDSLCVLIVNIISFIFVQRAVDALVQYVKDQMKDPVQVIDNYYDLTKKEVNHITYCIVILHYVNKMVSKGRQESSGRIFLK